MVKGLKGILAAASRIEAQCSLLCIRIYKKKKKRVRRRRRRRRLRQHLTAGKRLMDVLNKREAEIITYRILHTLHRLPIHTHYLQLNTTHLAYRSVIDYIPHTHTHTHSLTHESG